MFPSTLLSTQLRVCIMALCEFTSFRVKTERCISSHLAGIDICSVQYLVVKGRRFHNFSLRNFTSHICFSLHFCFSFVSPFPLFGPHMSYVKSCKYLSSFRAYIKLQRVETGSRTSKGDGERLSIRWLEFSFIVVHFGANRGR